MKKTVEIGHLYMNKTTFHGFHNNYDKGTPMLCYKKVKLNENNDDKVQVFFLIDGKYEECWLEIHFINDKFDLYLEKIQ